MKSEKTISKKATVKKTTTTKKVAVKNVAVNKISVNKTTPAGENKLEKVFTVNLSMTNLEFTGEGKNIVECLDQIAPGNFKTKGIFTISDGKSTKSVVMRPMQVSQLLSRSLNKEIFSKRMLTMLK